MLRYALYWLVMPFLGIVNGTFREFVIRKYFDAKAANQLSVATLIALLLIYGLLVRNKLNIHSKSDAWTCGIIWIVSTIIFEFGFGHYGAQKSFDELLENYNVFNGNLWPFILLFLGVLPFILLKRQS